MADLSGPASAGDLAMPAVTQSDLIGEVRAARAAADAAEVRILELALAWAAANPALPAGDVESDDDDDDEWSGIPAVRWDAPAAFAAANRMSTATGAALIRDVLVLDHRLPATWRQTRAGRVPAWRARRIAERVLGEPDDVAAYVDQHVAHRAGTVGLVTLDRLIDEAKLRLHAEEREIEQLEALDARYAHLYENSINHTGIAEMHLRGDWPDLKGFDEALSRVADALVTADPTLGDESLDVRRSIAVGVLADPERALALLANAPAPKAGRDALLHVHLTEGNLLGVDPVALDADGRAVLDQLVRQWCGRDDAKVIVRPVLDMTGPELNGVDHEHDGHALDDYRPSADDRERVALRDRSCVFPYCTRRADRCDCDHIVPHARGGPTCPCNLAPSCRHHHRLKTHAGWRYTMIEPGVYLWLDRHGQRFLRTPDGTRDIT